jgi:hypothetical protein
MLNAPNSLTCSQVQGDDDRLKENPHSVEEKGNGNKIAKDRKQANDSSRLIGHLHLEDLDATSSH